MAYYLLKKDIFLKLLTEEFKQSDEINKLLINLFNAYHFYEENKSKNQIKSSYFADSYLQKNNLFFRETNRKDIMKEYFGIFYKQERLINYFDDVHNPIVFKDKECFYDNKYINPYSKFLDMIFRYELNYMITDNFYYPQSYAHLKLKSKHISDFTDYMIFLKIIPKDKLTTNRLFYQESESYNLSNSHFLILDEYNIYKLIKWVLIHAIIVNHVANYHENPQLIYDNVTNNPYINLEIHNISKKIHQLINDENQIATIKFMKFGW